METRVQYHAENMIHFSGDRASLMYCSLFYSELPASKSLPHLIARTLSCSLSWLLVVRLGLPSMIRHSFYDFSLLFHYFSFFFVSFWGCLSFIPTKKWSKSLCAPQYVYPYIWQVYSVLRLSVTSFLVSGLLHTWLCLFHASIICDFSPFLFFLKDSFQVYQDDLHSFFGYGRTKWVVVVVPPLI